MISQIFIKKSSIFLSRNFSKVENVIFVVLFFVLSSFLYLLFKIEPLGFVESTVQFFDEFFVVFIRRNVYSVETSVGSGKV